MSGALSASMATGGAGQPPESFNVTWNGSSTHVSVNTSDGTTANKVLAVVSNGSGDYSFNWTVTSNPSGQLALSGSAAANRAIAWSGFVILESESITVQVDVTDNVTGFTGSDSITITITRSS